MKLKAIALLVVATSSFSLVSQAGITGAAWSTVNPDSLTGSAYSFHNDVLTMSGVQYSSGAQLSGSIQTDTPADPTLTLGSTVNNDTGNPWLGYVVNVAMDQPFTFTTPGASVSNPTANDWFVASVIAPTLQSSGPYAGKYGGHSCSPRERRLAWEAPWTGPTQSTSARPRTTASRSRWCRSSRRFRSRARWRSSGWAGWCWRGVWPGRPVRSCDLLRVAAHAADPGRVL